MGAIYWLISAIILHYILKETEYKKEVFKNYEKREEEEIQLISERLKINRKTAIELKNQLDSYTIPKILNIHYSIKNDIYHIECEGNIKGTFSLDKDDKINYLNVDGVNCLVMKDLRHIK